MIYEEITDPNLLRQIGGSARLVRVIDEIEDVCKLSSIAEKVEATKLRFTDETTLRLDITSPDDQVASNWGGFVRRLMIRPPLSITHARVGYYDDNIKLLYKDEKNWQAIAINTLGYSPKITLGVRDGLSYIKPAFAGDSDLIQGKRKEDSIFGETMTKGLNDEFFYDPVGFLNRYRGGMPIFRNGLMTVEEFGGYMMLINSVGKNLDSGDIKWSYGENFPRNKVLAVREHDLRGAGNPEGFSLLFVPESIIPQNQWRHHEDVFSVKSETCTPVLVFKNDSQSAAGAILIEKTYYCDSADKIRGKSISFVHSSLDHYKSRVRIGSEGSRSK